MFKISPPFSSHTHLNSTYFTAEDGVAPLSLDENPPGLSAAAVLQAVRTHKQHQSPWSDSSDHNGGSPSPRAPNNNSNGNGAARDRSCSRSPRFSEEYYRDNSDDDEEEDSADEELLESGVGGSGGEKKRRMKKSEKRKKFQEARKAHYGMKDALQKAKELLEDEVEGEEIDTMVEQGNA